MRRSESHNFFDVVPLVLLVAIGSLIALACPQPIAAKDDSDGLAIVQANQTTPLSERYYHSARFECDRDGLERETNPSRCSEPEVFTLNVPQSAFAPLSPRTENQRSRVCEIEIPSRSPPADKLNQP